MLEDAKGSSDGIKVTQYLKGEKYYVSEELFNDFVALKVGEEPKPEKPSGKKQKSENPVVEEPVKGKE